ncbi:MULTISPECIES: nucleoside-diphosphate kinase [Ignavibacterium]|uniref:nucleoside-diphosphate kinase n=1 Tax=Ignavibacterium TaxID=795750 RepID=UPI0025C46820|nr:MULTISPECIES: nucleoside-diphosphate kinase [Ignavibacterium]MBI5663257.1 nucleoside-diphosphate kinase [Ignavibacterium album]
MGNKTLAIIKPDAVSDGYIGEIISMITKAGFKIKAMKMVHLTVNQAKSFYEVHKERPFYNDLVEYMTSGPCVPIALEKENAVEDYRKLIGATDPAQAEEGTVRKLYARNKQFNAVHGSDSDENAEKEVAFFFSRQELLENYPN